MLAPTGTDEEHLHKRTLTSAVDGSESGGYAIDDPVAQEGDDGEIVAEFLSAREITGLLAEGSDGVSPGDVAAAVNGYSSVYEYLLAERSAPWRGTD